MTKKTFFYAFILMALNFFLAGCGEEKIRVYSIPKEKKVKLPMGRSKKIDLKWSAPESWVVVPASGMRAANFSIPGEGDKKAELSVVSLPGRAGDRLANVNRWRGQLGLPPILEAELDSVLVKKELKGVKVDILDQVRESEEALKHEADRMVVAFFPYKNKVWFFKLTGENAVLDPIKPVFLKFINTLEFL